MSPLKKKIRNNKKKLDKLDDSLIKIIKKELILLKSFEVKRKEK